MELTKHPTRYIVKLPNWQNIENIVACDGKYMVSESNYSACEFLYDFGIPEGSKINRVVVKVRGYVDNPQYGRLLLYIAIDAVQYWAQIIPIHENGTVPKDVEVDVTSINFNGGWTVERVNNMRVGVQVQFVEGGTSKIYVDCIPVTVDYTPPLTEIITEWMKRNPLISVGILVSVAVLVLCVIYLALKHGWREKF